MKRSRCLLSLCLIGLVAIAGCEPSAPPGYGIGNKANDFVGRDVDGRPIKFSDHLGKVVLLDFWATWCGPCVAPVPHEKQLMNTYKGRPFTIIGVSRDRSPDALREFLLSQNLPWPNIFDASGEISSDWGIDALPSFALLDEKGVIQGRWRGGSDMDEIEKKIQKMVRTLEQR